MKLLVLAMTLLTFGLPAAASSDGKGSRYFDPSKIATWSTCAKEEPATTTTVAECAPEGADDRLRGYSVQDNG